MGGTKHSAKFLLPLRAKHPSSLPLMLLAGHSLSQVTVSYVPRFTAFCLSSSKNKANMSTILSFYAVFLPMRCQQGEKFGAPSC